MDPPGPGPVSKPRPKPASSDCSKDCFPDFRESKPASSDCSKDWFPDFRESKPASSDCSKDWFPDFKEPTPEDQREQGPKKQLDAIFTQLEENILTFVKEELQRLHRILVSEDQESSSVSEEEQRSKEAVLNITLDFLRRMNQEQLAERLILTKSLGSSVEVCRDELKTHLQQKINGVFKDTPLHQIYTELCITEGGDSEINQEHEVRLIETTYRKPAATETSITCEDLFKGPAHRQQPIKAEQTEERPIRTVLTKGVAGVGKTVLTQKFSLDWAEGKTNQDIQLLFPFTFRELNVLRGTEYSLVGLLHFFFSQTKGLCSFEKLQVLFIFDGLDECRLPLEFNQTRVLTEPTESASVEVLLVNLIRGNLLPSACLWITTRPGAANQIPAECISMVTEVQGFSDPQKEQYFRKRFIDEQQATDVISHIKSIRSLYIMCHIPLFCWILSTILLPLMETRVRGELPHTLTQMYIHFLVFQVKVKNIKFREGSEADLLWTPETRGMVQSLGKLAFEQLQKGNLIFYETDLSECGLDAAEIACYSGVFTEVLREEKGLFQYKIYCFIHLSVQEFMAALYVHQTFFSSGKNLLSTPHFSQGPGSTRTSTYVQLFKSTVAQVFPFFKGSTSEVTFYNSAVDRALESPNGHLDLFLRFLLGLSLPTNQSLLPGLLTYVESDLTNQETIKYITEKLDDKDLSAEKSLNLLHCLSELNNHCLVEGIQWHLREGRLDLLTSPAQWSALSFFVMSLDKDLGVIDLRRCQVLHTALLKLLPVIKASTKVILSNCRLTSLSCGPLASVLCSSSLTHLDLSNNDLQDSGVELLCSGLKSDHCRLHTLRLSGCMISERGGECLASALSSTSSHLKELDLSYNHPGPFAELLIALQDNPNNSLESLRLDPTGEQWLVPGPRKYSCEFSLDPYTAQRSLLLSEDKRTVTRVREDQQYPNHEDRFMDRPQVLSSTGLRGRYYWEVQWSGRRVDIAVSYKGIRRRGDKEESRFGHNDKSWTLRIYGKCYFICHNKIIQRVYANVSDSDVVGVFLDSEAGTLSFYEVRSGGELFHLHTFFSCFTEPLFPGFWLWREDSSVSLVDLRGAPSGGPL